MSEEVYALEHGPRTGGGGVEAAAEGGILLLERANALSNTRRIRTIVRAVEMAEPFLGGQCSLAIPGELLTERAHERFQLAERFDVRSCVLGHSA
ncbi:MAG TPA: hypothetical protein VGP84_23025, partial [Gemmatimonadaceae bacterium]|nr:hypothetical protein [Gemmatimonadaceae bacterium]